MATASDEIIDAIGQDQHRDSLQFLTFLLGEEIYGVDILRVQEIKGWTPVTAIPNSPDYVQGVLNLRGEIVPIYDIRVRFNLENVDYTATTVIIVITVQSEAGERTIGLVVDGVWDVVNVNAEDMKETPDLGSNVNMEFIDGLADIDDRNVMLINSDKLFSEQELLTAMEQQEKDSDAS